MLHVPFIKFISIWSSWKYLMMNKTWISSLYNFLCHPVASSVFSRNIPYRALNFYLFIYLFYFIFFLQNKGHSVHITKFSYLHLVLAAGNSTFSSTDGFLYDKRSSHPRKVSISSNTFFPTHKSVVIKTRITPVML